MCSSLNPIHVGRKKANTEEAETETLSARSISGALNPQNPKNEVPFCSQQLLFAQALKHNQHLRPDRNPRVVQEGVLETSGNTICVYVLQVEYGQVGHGM